MQLSQMVSMTGLTVITVLINIIVIIAATVIVSDNDNTCNDTTQKRVSNISFMTGDSKASLRKYFLVFLDATASPIAATLVSQ